MAPSRNRLSWGAEVEYSSRRTMEWLRKTCGALRPPRADLKDCLRDYNSDSPYLTELLKQAADRIEQLEKKLGG